MLPDKKDKEFNRSVASQHELVHEQFPSFIHLTEVQGKTYIYLSTSSSQPDDVGQIGKRIFSPKLNLKSYPPTGAQWY